eukprot:CAMPEP_0195308796 /NCGR_PEP_ID=MMETSP0707-20130614/38412_1 /TAXON_ID=33640 /ORGANISM="Asterionellopsis glacialis, Strain CCMP134" /LENGTH=628 /DNA_ID=CAMNT_0040373083 /DNA_START=96 /DNA_END=1983 /DNA_ORIENTATION=-
MVTVPLIQSFSVNKLSSQPLSSYRTSATSSRLSVASTRNDNRRSLDYDDDDPFGDYEDDGPYEYSGMDYDDDDDDDDDFYGVSHSPSPRQQVNQKQTSEGAVPKSHFFSKKPLTDPNFSSRASKAIFQNLCQAAGITRPSRIQSLAWPVLLEGKAAIVADQTGSGKTLAYLIPFLAWPVLLEGKAAIVADQTGSGKTLAYLIPLLQRAILQIQKEGSSNNKRPNGAPRLLILSPTAELADQIRVVCDKLSDSVPFKTVVITATGTHNTNIRDQIRMLQRQPIDVLISTPGRIATILRSKDSGGLDLTSLQSIVLDEVDVLLIDETFGPQLRTVGVAAPVDKTQFVFVTATLPDTVVETVQREFRDVEKVRGPGLHRVAPTVKEHLVDVSVDSASNRDPKLCFEVKAKQLLKALRTNRCKRTLIFCNTVENCRMVENLLRRNDRRGQIYEVSAYHNAMSAEARNRNLHAFSHGNKSKDDRDGNRRGNKRGRGDAGGADYVLVCTDRAARGVDFDAAPVDHVVLFDFPKDPAEYVRRVGRTARAGRAGTSTVFAYGWQLPIARKIMGSKLDSFTIASNDVDDEDDEEYLGGVQGRKNQKKGSRKRKAEKDRVIKGNIEGGRVWKERKNRD